MRRKQVWRYYCDHCKKSGCSASHLAKHERGCTANPNRACGVCAKIELSSRPLPELIAFVRAKATHGESIEGDPHGSSLWVANDAVKQLREMADNCPACMLAALRQSNAFAGSQDFNFKAELNSLWSDYNEEHACYS